MPPVLFAIESNVNRALPVSAQRLVNFFTEIQDQTAKSQNPLYGIHGMTQFATCGDGPIRGGWVMDGEPYFVSGTEFYRVDSGGTSFLLGSGITGDGTVCMDDNGDQICIVNGQYGYIYEKSSNTFQQIGSPNFHSANTVRFFDGYFVFDWAGTNQYFLSGLYDGLTYNALDFASAESSSDFVTGTIPNLQILFIFGTKTIETWYDAGAESFPFARYQGASITRGCPCPHSILVEDNAIFFLGDDKICYRIQGTQLFRISTHAVETAFSTYSDYDSAFGFSYTSQGHKFVCFTFPDSGATWVYDIASQRWAERESRIGVTNIGKWRATCAVPVFDGVLFGDSESGKVGKLDWTTYTELGEQIIGTAVSAPFHANRQRVGMPLLELDMDVGVGLTSGQGSDPQIVLDWSDDGARTWSQVQRPKSFGKIGEYAKRVRWQQVGKAFYQRVLRVTVSDPVPRCIVQAHAETEVML